MDSNFQWIDYKVEVIVGHSCLVSCLNKIALEQYTYIQYTYILITD